MKNGTSTVMTVLFAVLAVAFAVLFISGNNRLSALNLEKDELTAQAETLKAEVVRAEEDASVRLDKAAQQKEELSAKLEAETKQK